MNACYVLKACPFILMKKVQLYEMISNKGQPSTIIELDDISSLWMDKMCVFTMKSKSKFQFVDSVQRRMLFATGRKVIDGNHQ